jgi:uncharacterized protein (DUF885 family)
MNTITRRDLIRTAPAAFALLPLLPALAQTSAASTPMGQRLRDFLVEADRQDQALDPQAAVMRGDLTQAHQFGDYISDDYHRAAEAVLRAQWKAFAAIDRAELKGTDRVAYDMFRYQALLALRRYDEGFVAFAQQMPMDHLFGLHVTFAQFSSGSGAPYQTVKDYDDGLARFEGFVLYLDRAIGRMREGLRARRVHSRLVAERVIAQLGAALTAGPQSSPYYGPIKTMPASFSDADRQRLTTAYVQAIGQRIQPALRRLARFMKQEYLPGCRTGPPGVSALPGGAAYYDYQLASMTTLPLGADEIHRIGLAEVARIRGEMERVRRQVGFAGSLSAFFEHLKNHPKFKVDSKAALLDAYRTIGQRVERALDQLFARRPASRLEIRDVPAEFESAVAGAYYQVGTLDGSRPGVFYVNTSDLPSRTLPRATALYLHEALPGHHMQGSLAMEATDLPPLLRFSWNVGYGEGWGLYAEWLGHEMGLYDDPYQHFGALDMEVFRATRLVVDTGLHAKRWPRERAVRYLQDDTSLDRSFIEQEVDRYIAWPGQATAYKLGELKIRALRDQAERALGARFDVRAFHTQVLDTGALPLAVLATKIEEWIGSQT